MAAAPTAAVPLDTLPRAAACVVAGLTHVGPDVDRLKRLGLCAGRRIELVRPGDPLIVRVHGARVGLAASLAAGVMVLCCDGCRAGEAEGR